MTTINPKHFINGPYVTCPKCGKNTFGILMICDHHYCRRCVECYYPHPSRGEDNAIYPLPKLNKKVIYLDQFSISSMMKFLNPNTKGHMRARADVFWGDLFERLDTLCKLQLVSCPDSDFHEHESLLAPYYKQLKRIYEFFSHSVSLYDHETIKRFQIMGHLKIWMGNSKTLDLDVHKVTHGEINAWQGRFIISLGDYNQQELIDELRSNREKADDHMEEVFKRWQCEKDKDFNYWYNQEKKSEAVVINKSYNRYLLNMAKAYFGGAPFEVEALLPDFASLLISGIKNRFKDNGITGEENLNKNVREFLQSETFEDTPYIKISSMLHAAMARRAAHQGRKRPPGRGYVNDVKIISTILPYCDAMFIDNECRSLLLEKPLCDEIDYNTKLFSLSNKQEFTNYLEDIRQIVSDAHMKAVKEVYGEDRERPYWEIFKSSRNV